MNVIVVKVYIDLSAFCAVLVILMFIVYSWTVAVNFYLIEFY